MSLNNSPLTHLGREAEPSLVKWDGSQTNTSGGRTPTWGGGLWLGSGLGVRDLFFSPSNQYWRGQRKVLRKLLFGGSSEGPVGSTLVHALRQPLTHHVQQYVLLLLSLADTIEEVGS